MLLLGLLRFSKSDHPQLGQARKLTYRILLHLGKADGLTDVGCLRRSGNNARVIASLRGSRSIEVGRAAPRERFPRQLL